jgi:hypothetical protein
VGLSAPLLIEQLARKSPVPSLQNDNTPDATPPTTADAAPTRADEKQTAQESLVEAHYLTTDSHYGEPDARQLKSSVRQISPGVWAAQDRELPTAKPVEGVPIPVPAFRRKRKGPAPGVEFRSVDGD